MGGISDLISNSGFHDGLAAGLVGFAAVGAVAAVAKRRPATVAGLAFAAGGAAAIAGYGPFSGTGTFPGRVTLGLAVLALGGLLVRWWRPPLPVTMLLLLPGGLIVGYGTGLAPPYDPSWVQPLVAFGAAIGGAFVLDVDYAQRARALGPIMFAVSAAAVYTTVPDTERAVVLVGVAVVLGLSSFPTPLSSLGPEGAAASTGLLLWVAAADGHGRPGSIVGAVGALGLFLTEPLVRRIAHRARPRLRREENQLFTVLVVTALQTVLCLYAARVAGFEHTGGHALLMLVPGVVTAAIVSIAMPPPRGRGTHRRPRSPRRRGEHSRRRG